MRFCCIAYVEVSAFSISILVLLFFNCVLFSSCCLRSLLDPVFFYYSSSLLRSSNSTFLRSCYSQFCINTMTIERECPSGEILTNSSFLSFTCRGTPKSFQLCIKFNNSNFLPHAKSSNGNCIPLVNARDVGAVSAVTNG